MWKVIKQLLLWLVAVPVALLTLLCALSERVPVAAGWLTAIILSIQHALASPWRLGFICVGVLGWLAAYFVSDRFAEPKYQALRRKLANGQNELSNQNKTVSDQENLISQYKLEIASLTGRMAHQKELAAEWDELDKLRRRGEALAEMVTFEMMSSSQWGDECDRIIAFMREVMSIPAPWRIDLEGLYIPYFVKRDSHMGQPLSVDQTNAQDWKGVRKYVQAGVREIDSIQRQIISRLL